MKDETGHPVVARITNPGPFGLEGTTRRDGTLDVEVAHPWGYDLEIRAEGSATARRSVEVTVTDADVALDVVLPTGAVLDASVHDADKIPVEGVALRVLAEGRATSLASTDRGGRALIADLAPGEVDVLAIHAARRLYGRTRVALEGRERTSVELELRPFGRVTGRVTDRVSRPVSGAFVRAMPLDALDRPSWDAAPGPAAHSNERGEFVIEGVFEGTYSFSVRPAENRPLVERVRRTTVFPDQTHVELVADYARMEGRVIADGTPLAGARVEASLESEPEHRGSRVDAFVRETAPDGSFAFAELPPGEWRLWFVHLASDRRFGRRRTLLAGQTDRLEVALARTEGKGEARLHGRAIDLSGAGRKPTGVRLVSREGKRRRESPVSASGEFVLGPIEPGRYFLRPGTLDNLSAALAQEQEGWPVLPITIAGDAECVVVLDR